MSGAIPPIETEYNGTLYRSSTEARWACFFDLCDLPFQYEARDLRGYIPDFIVPLNRQPQLIEVRGEDRFDDLAAHLPGIYEAGWEGEATVVGSTPFFDRDWGGFPTLGVHADGARGEMRGQGVLILGRCESCKSTSLIDGELSFNCRNCGANGSNHLRPIDDCKRLWGEAQNLTRWLPKKPKR